MKRYRIQLLWALPASALLLTGCAATGFATLAPKVVPGQSVLGQNTPFLGKPVEIVREGTNLVVNFIGAKTRRTAAGIAVDISSLSILTDTDGRVQRVLPSEGILNYHRIGNRSIGTANELPADLFMRLVPGKSTLATATNIIGAPFRIGLTLQPQRRVVEWSFARLPWKSLYFEHRLLQAEVDDADVILSLDIHEVRPVHERDFRWLIPARPRDGMLIDSHPDNR